MWHVASDRAERELGNLGLRIESTMENGETADQLELGLIGANVWVVLITCLTEWRHGAAAIEIGDGDGQKRADVMTPTPRGMVQGIQ